MVVTSVLGHLKTLEFSAEYADWQTVPVLDLFSAPIKSTIPQTMLDVAENLKVEARRASMLVIWTDCDREGEYIGSEIVDVCLEVNSRLTVSRARYSVLTSAELHRVMRSLGQLDQRQVAAAQLRSELDLRSGAAFTRLQTLQLRSRQEELNGHVISYGSCQFPTLGFVVEQYLRIVNFREEPFWQIHLELQDHKGIITRFSWQRGRLFDHLIALILYERCLERPTVRITKVESKPTSKWRPLPLRTVELQKFGSRYLKMSSDRVMEIAEKLYNQGYISYPRTETDMFEPSFDLRTIINQQRENPKWGPYAVGLLDGGAFHNPRKGKNNDKAHPPIHPTREGVGLAGGEAKVYEFIVRRFLACCSEDARGQETVILARLRDETFRARGVVVEALNYLEVYIYEHWTDQRIGTFAVNQEVTPHALELQEGCTTAPNLLSESELIGTMDKNGIGTDATIHEHIKKILERQYVIKNSQGRFHPTNLGLALVRGYDRVGLEESLTKPRLRAAMEQRLKDICDGSITKTSILPTMISQFVQALNSTFGQIYLLIEEVQRCAFNGSLFSPAPLNVANDRNQRSSTLRNRPRDDSEADDGGEDDDDDFNHNSNKTNQENRPNDRVETRKRRKPLKLPKKPQTKPRKGENEQPKEQICNCTQSMPLRFTKKAGPNVGRGFWACSKCNFFTWADEEPNQATIRTATTTTTAMTSRVKTLTQKSTILQCRCGKNAVERTVVKEGPNQGKKFFACLDQICGFFQWADEVPPQATAVAISTAPTAHPKPQLQQQPQQVMKFGHNRQCKCGMEAVRLMTVNGPNAGRSFFKCSKMVQRCDYFEWEDGINDDRGVASRTRANSTRGRYQGKKSNNSASRRRGKKPQPSQSMNDDEDYD